MSTEHKDNSDVKSPGYEKRDAKTLKIFIIGFIGVLLIVVSIIALNEMFLSVREQAVSELVLQPESNELRLVRAQSAELLSTYAWVDSVGGKVRIPIERAMELIAAEAYSGDGK